jgi:peptide deformylase
VIYPNNLQLHTDGHPILRQVAEPVTEFDGFLQDFCTRMLERMERWGGCGLAAPQVGVSRRIIVTGYGPSTRIWINPRLSTPVNVRLGAGEERCLSFPGQRAMVERFTRLTVHYQTVDGKPAKKFFNTKKGDFLGVILQHEVDHLDGILLPDRAVEGTLTPVSLEPEHQLDRILRLTTP